MALHQDFSDILRCLNDAGAKYLIVGAHAVSFYTEPRFTKDIDILVEPTLENAAKVYRALLEFGAPLRGVGVEDLANPTMMYQIGVEPVRIDIIMGIDGVDFQNAWSKKVATNFGEEKIYILGIDDLIKAKKIASRDQDHLDLKKLAKVKKKK